MEKRTYKILIAASGSVAAIKVPYLVSTLLDSSSSPISFEVRVILTEHAKHFFDSNDVPKLAMIYDDSSEWNSWSKIGDPVIHIELGKWADMMVIAPLDANTLAKMAQGICDNLLTCTARAWPMNKPLLFCPAMNTRMWDHPITAQQTALLQSWGYEEVHPVCKLLACGDLGVGAMAEVDTIVQRIYETIKHIKTEETKD